MYKIDTNAPQILKDNQDNSQVSDLAFILKRSSLDNRATFFDVGASGQGQINLVLVI
jgi:hypothetical protein